MRNDELELITRAIDEAARCVSEPGKVSPRVAAVLAVEGIFVDSAYRGEIRAGEHAEFTLIEGKQPSFDMSRATVYTTLEPCTERTDPKQPCARRLIDRGVRDIVIGMLDPDPRVYGIGFGMLKRAGIRVRFFPDRFRELLVEMNREFIAKYSSNNEHTGNADFDPSQNNGNFLIGSDDFAFETHWSQRGHDSMYFYSDPATIEGIAIAVRCSEFEEVTDASAFDRSSRSHALNVGEIGLLKNVNGYFALIKLTDVNNLDRGAGRNRVQFEYRILTNGASDFSQPKK